MGSHNAEQRCVFGSPNIWRFVISLPVSCGEQLCGKLLTLRSTFFSILHRIAAAEGLRGFWRGLGPSTMRGAPSFGVYFFFLEEISGRLKNQFASNTAALPGNLAFVSAFISRSITSAMFVPLSVVKTRFEATTAGNSKPYSSTTQALRTIAAEEGVRALYSGTLVTILRDAPHAAIFFSLYNLGKTELVAFRPADSKIPVSLIHFISGVFAGCVATVASQPFDVVRTRLQTRFVKDDQVGFFKIFAKIYQVCFVTSRTGSEQLFCSALLMLTLAIDVYELF